MKKLIIGKLAYTILLTIFIPIGLIIWAKATEDIVRLPPVKPPVAGIVLMIGGFLLMIWGTAAFWIFGRGLPMNAYSPKVLVRQGPYRWLRHPIYCGFGMLVTGYFIFTGSASGFWMVAPLTVFGMIALVNGYETIELKKRFPGQTIRTKLDYPESKEEAASYSDRFYSAFKVLMFLLFSNYLLLSLYIDLHPLWGNPLLPNLNLDKPVLIYVILVLIVLFPMVLKQKRHVRRWELESCFGLSLSTFVGLLFPEVGIHYFPVSGFAFTAIPVFLILISMVNAFRQSFSTVAILGLPVAVILFVLLNFSRSFELNFIVSILITTLACNYFNIWLALRDISEKIANSWEEWTFGPIRVINHGFYVGTGALTGILLAGYLAGKEYIWAILIFTIIVNITAALWAQIIEGSTKLKRPFGYYGGIAGIAIGAFMVWMIGFNAWVVIGVVSVVMPWVQAIGRLRCLVNGCCHGRKTDNPSISIRYYHPRSRVCNLSDMKGEMIHPTPLYSILWLLPVGLFLLMLWLKGSQPPLIFGLYLILTSFGRFVEEAFRGEVQTPILGGMHLYQWTSIITLIAGILMTTIQTTPVVLKPDLNWELLGISLLCGLFVFFAMGVDFPGSNVRFSRLV